MIRIGERRLSPASVFLLAAAWLALVVVLLAAWAAAPSPTVATADPSPPLSGLTEEETEEEDEEEETEEELEFEVDGEGEWLQLEEESGGEEEGEPVEILPPECLLRAAHPRAILDSRHAKLRLALRFKAWSATRVGAVFQLKGARGSLRLGVKTHHPGRSGTLRLSRHLGRRALGKARATRVVIVRLVVPGTPRYCHLTMRLRPTRR